MNVKRIFTHELAHIRGRHSLDVLFSSVCRAVFWWNRVFGLVKRELCLIHEFIADRESIAPGDTQSFAEMILDSMSGRQKGALQSAFSSSDITMRLKMINSPVNIKYLTMKKVFILPVCLIIGSIITVDMHKPEDNAILRSASIGRLASAEQDTARKPLVVVGVIKFFNGATYESVKTPVTILQISHTNPAAPPLVVNPSEVEVLYRNEKGDMKTKIRPFL